MAVSNTDTQSILTKAYNFTNVTSTTLSQLKCFTCGKRAYQSSSYVVCTSAITAHRLLNLDYIVAMADMHEGFTRAYENIPTLIDKPIT